MALNLTDGLGSGLTVSVLCSARTVGLDGFVAYEKKTGLAELWLA